MQRDRRRLDVQVNSRVFKSLYKNRAAFEVARVAILQHGVHPEEILTQTYEGLSRRDRASRPILKRFTGRLDGEQVRRALWGQAPSNVTRYYWLDEDLIHVGDETWVFTRGWSGEEVERFIQDLNRLVPALDATYTVTRGTGAEVHPPGR